MCAKIDSRIFKTAKRFIEQVASEPVRVMEFMEDEQTFVARDEDDNIVFVKVLIGHNEFPEATPREEREAIMCRWMRTYDEGEAMVRFNELRFAIMNDNRALARYEVSPR